MIVSDTDSQLLGVTTALGLGSCGFVDLNLLLFPPESPRTA